MILTIRENYALLNEPIDIEFDIYDNTLEQKMLDSHDFTLYGFTEISAFARAVKTEYNKELLKMYKEQVTILKGGRLDILVCTDDKIARLLHNMYLFDDKDKSILTRLYDKLAEMGNEDLEGIYQISNIEQALRILA